MTRMYYKAAVLLLAALCLDEATAAILNTQWPLPSNSPNVTVYEGDLILPPELCEALYGSQVCGGQEVRPINTQ